MKEFKKISGPLPPWPPSPSLSSATPMQSLPRLPPSPLRVRPGLQRKWTPIVRKQIPKKIRGEAWMNEFGSSTKGYCYCCRKGLDIFDTWHAGHIVSYIKGGTDTADNLRPLCPSCNLSMGIENMDDFKERCYPPPPR